MEISEDAFTELLRCWSGKPEPAEARRLPRVLTRRHVTVISDSSDPVSGTSEVVLQDISRGGVRISHHEGMPRGKQFILLLAGPNPRPMRLGCIVRHCRMVKQHLFEIGAEFEKIDPLTA